MPTTPAPNNLFDGVSSVSWGFAASDIWTNSVAIFSFLAAFVLLGIVLNVGAPKVVDLVRNAFK
ncbi:hypothetical protein P9314_05265 [Paenibacillus validus]|uniref:hypothetical protein n=1 Tax=Paenibacillus validus TaxID=44253 RepID=UPI000FD9C4CF|nr:hypothetical protein [Paenibacillus validus]MED4600119.1 hypothetical protein [Paenibacillus validus]MED4605566.1 hypothetical protein [Paenibacillus validus]